MLTKKILTFFKKKMTSENTRAFRRMQSYCLIRYNLLSDPTRKKTLVNPRDISAGGTSFISKTNFPKGTMLEMDIHLPPLKGFLTVIAKAVDSLKVRGQNLYLVRTDFKAIDPADKKRINLYIEQAAKNPYLDKYFDRKASKFKREIDY